MTTGRARGPRRSGPCGSGRPTVPPSARAGTASRWVSVTCPACGVVRVRADRVVVRRCIDDQSWSYRARCSKCDTTFVGATAASLARPAIASGLTVEHWSLPKPSARRSGSPLQVVDILELHLALLESDWFDQWRRVEPLGDR